MPLVSAAQRGVETGLATGGRLSGLGTVFKGIADRLRQTRETEEEVGVLGRTERVKAKIKAEYTPTPEWKPTTEEQALGFERAKGGLKAKPTEWDLQKEAQDEAFRRLGGTFGVGLTEESRTKYETLADEIYQGLRGQYGYTEAAPTPIPTPTPTPELSKDITATNPATGEKMIFRDGRWQSLK